MSQQTIMHGVLIESPKVFIGFMVYANCPKCGKQAMTGESAEGNFCVRCPECGERTIFEGHSTGSVIKAAMKKGCETL